MSKFLPKGAVSLIGKEAVGMMKDAPKNMARAIRDPKGTIKDIKTSITTNDLGQQKALMNKYAPSSQMTKMVNEQTGGVQGKPQQVDGGKVAITNMSLTDHHPKGLKTPRSVFGNILSQIPVLKQFLGLGQGPKQQGPGMQAKMKSGGPKSPFSGLSGGPKAPGRA